MLQPIMWGAAMVFFVIMMFSSPLSLESANKKRIAKNKPALTEEEFLRKVKRERIIACVILGMSYLAAMLAYTQA
jgi:uncharacterized membrane protein